MRMLILGGTAMLGRELARAAVTAGHQVTCLARGRSGEPPAGVRFLTADRDDPAQPGRALAGERFDAVVDVTSRPSHARAAVAALASVVDHWTQVSTISVYADQATPGQRVDTAPVVPPASDQDDAGEGVEAYAANNVACERLVAGGLGADRALICRAGLIVGPGDTSGRFGYWVARLARGGRVLAPGDPTDPVQVIDVRDLAGWLVHAAAQRLAGVFDTTSPPVSRGELLSQLAAGVASQPELTWVDQAFLAAHQVRPWAGERSLPLWVPLPEYAGLMTRDTAPALAAGLRVRPFGQTAADTLAWLRQQPGPPAPEALTADDEAALLRAWDARPAAGQAHAAAGGATAAGHGIPQPPPPGPAGGPGPAPGAGS